MDEKKIIKKNIPLKLFFNSISEINLKGIFSRSFILAFLIVFYTVPINILSQKDPQKFDFSAFYNSTLLFLNGDNIYKKIPHEKFEKTINGIEKIEKGFCSNLNPPFQTVIMAPLGFLSYSQAFRAWWIFSLCCGIGAVLLLWFELEGRTPIMLLNILIIWLCYFPTLANMVYGQFGLLLMLLIIAGWFSLRHGKERLAGLFLGIAFSLKIFSGFFLFFLLGQRRYRTLIWFIGFFVFSGLFAGLIAGFDSYKNYLLILKEINWYASSWNASAFGFFSRIFGGSLNIPLIDCPWLTRTIHYLFGFFFVIASFILSKKDQSYGRIDISFSFSIVAMLLISPLGWMYYFPVLLLPLIVLWHETGKCQSNWQLKFFLVLSWCLSTIPHYLIPPKKINDPIIWFTWAGFYFYSLILFAALMLYLANKSPSQSMPSC